MDDDGEVDVGGRNAVQPLAILLSPESGAGGRAAVPGSGEAGLLTQRRLKQGLSRSTTENLDDFPSGGRSAFGLEASPRPCFQLFLR